jgi:hypothetical protein
MNNICSILELTKDAEQKRLVYENSPYALQQTLHWVRADYGRWWISGGRGRCDHYTGNRDAAQFWFDLHTDGDHEQSAYTPSADNTQITVGWVAVGRTFPFEVHVLRGSGSIGLRHLVADSYLTRSIEGQVDGESFSGMLRTISSDTGAGTVRGNGWAVDADLQFKLNDSWLGRVNIEGMIGRLRWNGLVVQDGYITSAGVFTDPEGFLRDCGGITGAEWSTNINTRLKPVYRLDLVSNGRPNVLLGYTSQPGTYGSPCIGLAWANHRNWLPYLRFYPIESRTEVGFIAHRWQLRISVDDWTFDDPKRIEAAVSVNPILF